MSNNALEIRDLCKKFNKKEIVSNFSLNIQAGKIVGLVGPNGAGKTTIMKMIVGLISPSSGDIHIYNKNILNNFKLAINDIGAIIESPQFYGHMSAYRNIMQYARIYKISKKRVLETLKIVGLEQRLNDKVKNYSLGMKQRLGIAQAILHEPKLLILDEPINGLDPAGVLELRIYLKKLVAKSGCAILISSHILTEMDMLCDEIAMIDKGNLLEIKQINDRTLNFEKQDSNVTVDFNIDITDNIDYIISQNPFASNYIISKNILTFDTILKFIPDINAYLVKNNIKVYGISIQTSSLETDFLNLTGGNKNERIG
jgi:ABC-2 type transport system ATP-binding protein